MGNTRIQTVSRVLASPPKDEEEMHALYQAFGLQKSGDTFETPDEMSKSLREPGVVARKLAGRETRGVENKTDLGVARVSDDFRKILTLAKKIDDDEKPLQLIELYSRAASFLLSDTSAKSIKNLATATLKEAYDDRQNQDPDSAARHIAVAIGLHFEGTPSDVKHREQVEAFIDSYFAGEAHVLGNAIKKVIHEPLSAETARLLVEKRARDLEKSYELD